MDPTMEVVFLYDHVAGQVAGAESARATDRMEVPFSVGARLVAAGYAEEAPEPAQKSRKSKEDD